MISTYDPEIGPDPKEWSSLDDSLKITIVEDFHDKAGVDLPNTRLHAAVHIVVENQVTMGDETPVQGTLTRLMKEGLDRHDALHAIGSILSKQLFHLLNEKAAGGFDESSYYNELDDLTAEGWSRGDFSG